jgi:hypothetical protein
VQVPFTDGKAAFAKNIKERGYLRIARAVIAGVHDILRSAINMPAAYYPLIGEPGMTNFMGLTQDEQDAYYAKHPAKKQVCKLCCLPYQLLCFIACVLHVHRPSLLSVVA